MSTPSNIIRFVTRGDEPWQEPVVSAAWGAA